MAKMICLCGISGSGKTTWAKKFMTEHPDWLYFNPDDYYARINGDECDRRNAFEVWHSLFRDVHTAALNNKNVLIDSNNLTFHQRMQWIEWFPEFKYHILIVFTERHDICWKRVCNRQRTIPKGSFNLQCYRFENPIKDSLERDVDYWSMIIGKKEDVDFDSLLAEALEG
jgi:predicted kinase